MIISGDPEDSPQWVFASGGSRPTSHSGRVVFDSRRWLGVSNRVFVGGHTVFHVVVKESTCLVSVLLLLGFPRACAPEPDGAVLFLEHCASCHLDPLFPRAPHLDMMQGWNREVIVTALSSGIMVEQGRELSATEQTAVADYISLGGLDEIDERDEHP